MEESWTQVFAHLKRKPEAIEALTLASFCRRSLILAEFIRTQSVEAQERELQSRSLTTDDFNQMIVEHATMLLQIWCTQRMIMVDGTPTVQEVDIRRLSIDPHVRQLTPVFSIYPWNAAALFTAIHISLCTAESYNSGELQALLQEWRETFHDCVGKIEINLLGKPCKLFEHGLTIDEMTDWIAAIRRKWNTLTSPRSLMAVYELFRCIWPYLSLMVAQMLVEEHDDLKLAAICELELAHFYLIYPGQIVLDNIGDSSFNDLLPSLRNADKFDETLNAIIHFTKMRTEPGVISVALTRYYEDLQVASLPPGTAEWDSRARNSNRALVREYKLCERLPLYRTWIRESPQLWLDNPESGYARSHFFVRFACELLSIFIGYNVYNRHVVSNKFLHSAEGAEKIKGITNGLIEIGHALFWVYRGKLYWDVAEKVVSAFVLVFTNEMADSNAQSRIRNNLRSLHAQALLNAPAAPMEISEPAVAAPTAAPAVDAILDDEIEAAFKT
jgi:hypothetical protein